MTDRDLIEPSEASELLGVEPRTIARWADSGRLWVTFTAGGHRRYDRAEIKALKLELEATR